MAVKGVFFDLYRTLVTYQPPQEELEAIALKELGVTIDPANLRRPIIAADEFIYEEIAKRPLSVRSPEEKAALYARYQEIVLREAGVPHDRRLVLGLLGKMQQASLRPALFDDVAPTLTELSRRGLVLGLISNVEQDIAKILHTLGLDRWLGIIVTSQDAGASKPDPRIFQLALRKAGLSPAVSIYVGDQYRVDIAGARAAGMAGILLDRDDYYEKVTDCLRIRSLTELVRYL